MAPGYSKFWLKSVNLSEILTIGIPQSHRPNRHKTDKNHQIRGEIGLQSVLIRFCRFGVGLCSGRQICRGEIFQICLKDISPTNCRLYVGVVSVLSGSVRGRVGLNSATDSIWFVGVRSVMYRAYVGRPDADSRPNQVRHNTELRGVGRHIPESKPTSTRHISKPNRM